MDEKLSHAQLIPKTITEPARSWHEENSVIYFSVTSNCATGPQWIEHLERRGDGVSSNAKSVLRSDEFKPAPSPTTYKIAVLKGMIFEDKNRITKKIRDEAERRSLTKPNAEVACLVREQFTDKEIGEMGLWWIIAMHEPIKDSDSDPVLLGAYHSEGGPRLRAGYDRLGFNWAPGNGFAFVVSKVSA